MFKLKSKQHNNHSNPIQPTMVLNLGIPDWYFKLNLWISQWLWIVFLLASMHSYVLRYTIPSHFLLPVSSATCRRPIRGAAGRPAKPLDLWPEESLLHQRVFTTTKSSLAHSHSTPSYAQSFSSPSELRPCCRSFSIWLKLLVFLMLAASLYYIFQNVSSEQVDSYMLFLQDRVVTPLLTTIGVISREDNSGSKWMRLPVCAWAVSIIRLEPHPHLTDWRINILSGFVLIYVAVLSHALLSHAQLCVPVSL